MLCPYLYAKREWGGRERTGEERREKKRRRIRYWRRCTKDQEIEQRYIAVGDGQLGVATRKHQMPGK